MWKGFQSLVVEAHGQAEMWGKLILVLLIGHVTLSVAVGCIFHPKAWALLADGFRNFEFGMLGLGTVTLIGKNLVWGAPIWLALPVILKRIRRRQNELQADKHVRGPKLLTENELAAQLRQHIAERRDRSGLPLGRVRIPRSFETLGGFICGATGSGKSHAGAAILDYLRGQKSRVLIYDYAGDYIRNFYDARTDFIFNPLDSRCVGWTAFNEISRPVDIISFARSMIPYSRNVDAFWNDAARSVFSGILQYLHVQGRRENRDIWETINLPIDEIAEILHTTPGCERGYTFIQGGRTRQAESVHAVLMQYALTFEFMTALSGPFSIGRWLQDASPGFLFVTNRSDLEDTLRPILSLAVDLVGRHLLTLPEDPERRRYFFIDEIGTLQQLPTIVKLLTQGRKRGGSTWIGAQGIGQVEKTYGKDWLEDILGNTRNNMIFAVEDERTAEYFSKKLGEAEKKEVDEILIAKPGGAGDGLSFNPRTRKERLLTPYELHKLEQFKFVLNVPYHDPCITAFPPERRTARAAAFIENPSYDFAEIGLKTEQVLAAATAARGYEIPAEFRAEVEKDAEEIRRDSNERGRDIEAEMDDL